MGPIIAIGLFYALGMPILVRLVCLAHKQVFITRKAKNMPRSRTAQTNLPKPLWPKIKERVRYAVKDTRPLSLGKKKEEKSGGLTNKQAVVGAWAAGLLVAVGAAFMGQWKLIVFSPLLFLVALTIALVTANPIIKGREQIYRKMFEIGKSTLGLSAEYAEQPQAVINILEWRDVLRPSKVRFEVPTTFGADSEESFLRQFNQVFGTETTWVAFNDPESGKPGWNYEEGFVTLKETPPLPTMAPWHERYVLDPNIAWSFFPIGLGVENGVELTNPETGQVENVLGFDLSGEQVNLAKKMGTKIGPEITTSPMVLCAGGTGGGKALAVDTPVLVLDPQPN